MIMARPSFKSDNKAIILGCGPSGLLAAHACAMMGFDPVIYSLKVKSPVGKAQFMHAPIPLIHEDRDEQLIAFDKIGSKEGYAQKVYGYPEARCSWEQFPVGYLPGYPVATMYDQLWELYSDKVIGFRIDRDCAARLRKSHGLVINTIPAINLCYQHGEHTFPRQQIWIKHGQPGDRVIPDNTMIYNGIPKVEWYRASSLFGVVSTEYTVKPRGFRTGRRADGTMIGNGVEGFKPLDTNCNCNPGIHRVGRFGTWQKGVLLHHAFNDAFRIAERHRAMVYV